MSTLLKRALMLGALVAISLPVLAFADNEGPFASFDIKVESTAVDSELSPMVKDPITKDQVQFHIINNTGKQLFYVNGPDQQTYVPIISNSTVTVPYHPGQQYQLVDAEGHSVAKWNLDNSKMGATSVAGASQAQFSQWGSTLQQVIENQKVTYQEPAAKPEPRYSSNYSAKSGARTSDVVRGYW
jgi:hypothetical protein